MDPPEPSYAFDYRDRPRAGNEINGLGEAAYRRPVHVFHNAGTDPIDWQAIDDFFGMISPWGVIRHVVANAWQLRNKDGPVARQREAIADPALAAEEIKAVARSFGAELVGITKVTDDDLYQGHDVPYRTAICLSMPMDRAEMAHVPQPRAAVEVLRVYRAVSRSAIRLASHIRKMGYGAVAYGNPNSTDILHIPLAARAGLGELGKHGSLITQEYGSNIRLAAVLTELPLALDEPVDIAVEDMCVKCRRCTLDCPADAISDEKRLIRGGMKWYVDFDKCIPYFVKTDGCAICIQVCPWSIPDRGPSLSKRLLSQRER